MSGTYNSSLVALSFAIALIASYSALDLAGRVQPALGRVRLFWLLGGAIAMGSGIWSMHFIAMLAFHLPLAVNYDAGITLLSLLCSVVASGIALFLLSRPGSPLLLLLGGGVCMGIGIAGMHYTGMAAMRLDARLDYDLGLVSLSVAIAITASFVALWLAFRLQGDYSRTAIWRKFSSAFIMGLAINGMHYTGMWATHFIPQRLLASERSQIFNQSLLAVAVGIATLLILSVTHITSLYDRRLTAQLMREQALQESEKRFRTLIRDMQVGVLLLNAQAEIIISNQAAIDLLNLKAENLTHQTFGVNWSILQEDGTCFLHTELPVQQAIFQQQPVRNVVMQIEHRETQERRWLLVNADPQVAEDGSVERVVCTLSDITARKQVEQVLQKAKEAADAANHAKSEFLANMSHELRTPLNAILGFTQVISRDSSLSPEHQQYLGIISRSGEHLLSLLNDILEMSKIEAGRLTVNESSFDLIRLLNTLEEMLRLKAESKSLELIFEIAPNTPQYVKTDESKLRSCLINLLGNAIKFTHKGRVTLRAGVGTTQESTQFLIPNAQSTITFEVEDTGDGIAPEEIDLLFEPFRQTETGRKLQQGSGLGLTISRKFVQLLGGDIAVSSHLGKGSVFKFDIQVSLGEAIKSQQTQAKTKVIGLAPDQPEYRILVVEDQLENRLLLTQLLTTIGFTVWEAQNGQEAVALWESWKPHLIWMDMRMSVMDGYEATKEIRAREMGRWGDRRVMESQTIIIALTANAFEEDRHRALSVGCDSFVHKPFQDVEILEKIAQYLGVLYQYEKLNSSSAQCDLMSNKFCKKSDYHSSFSIPSLKEEVVQMPAEWVAKLHSAARSAREKQIWELIEQIPPDKVALAEALTKKVKEFRLDYIIDLTSND